MNILMLAAGAADFDPHDGSYPLCLAEFDGKPLIERTIAACSKLEGANLIVAVREADVRQFHLDNIVSILDPRAKIISIKANTQGAACTALLATGYIDNDESLLIINANELLAADFATIVSDFKRRNLDAGVVTFPSVHPRYSYVRLSEDGMVVEAAEKNPLSRHATVGFYWFARGKDFVSAAQNSIRKDASVNGLFYICPTLNELVLKQAVIGTHPIEAKLYHPLKTERQLAQFEAAIDNRTHYENR